MIYAVVQADLRLELMARHGVWLCRVMLALDIAGWSKCFLGSKLNASRIAGLAGL